MSFALSLGPVVTFLLVTTRLLAAFFIAPPFNGAMVPIRVRLALAGAIALVVSDQQSIDIELETLALLGAVTYQVVVGAAFGYLVNLMLSAATIAGSMVDNLAGFSAATLFDPFSQSSSSPAARINQVIALVILVLIEGHLLIVRGILRSFSAAPIDGLRVDAMGAMLTRGVGQLMIAAIEIALPVLAALLLAEVVLALAARAAPRLNVMVVGFAVKSMILLATFALMVPLVINSVSTLLVRSLRWAMTTTGA